MTSSHDIEATAAPLPNLPLAIGDVVGGKYRVDRLLFLDGDAAVFGGTNVSLDRPIALKLLLSERAARPDAPPRGSSTSDHGPRIADVDTAETADGRRLPFLVIDLIEARDRECSFMERGSERRLASADDLARAFNELGPWPPPPAAVPSSAKAARPTASAVVHRRAPRSRRRTVAIVAVAVLVIACFAAALAASTSPPDNVQPQVPTTRTST